MGLDLRRDSGSVPNVDPKNKPQTNLSIRLETETLEVFRRIAESQHRTMAGELRRLIETRIAQYEADEQQAA